MEIILTNAEIRMGQAPNGNKILQFVTPAGIVVTVPLDGAAARSIAAFLSSGIIVANGAMPEPPKSTN